jgi:hypothetical protein
LNPEPQIRVPGFESRFTLKLISININEVAYGHYKYKVHFDNIAEQALYLEIKL